MSEKNNVLREKYDVIVIGAGHAGCEAALAAARLGQETIMFTAVSYTHLKTTQHFFAGPGIHIYGYRFH